MAREIIKTITMIVVLPQQFTTIESSPELNFALKGIPSKESAAIKPCGWSMMKLLANIQSS